jgi:hypothetical protein
LTRVVFDPEVQSVPKMVSGPTKKKIVAARKKKKNTMTPIENSPSRHVPLFYFLDIPFMDPESPATPSNKKRMDER